jgi:hypothetical protein
MVGTLRFAHPTACGPYERSDTAGACVRRPAPDIASLIRATQIAGHSFSRSQCASSPTIPRRNSSTHITKIAPCTTNTHCPIWVR